CALPIFTDLPGAVLGVGAAQVDVALLLLPEGGVALGATPGHHELPLGAVTSFHDRGDDLGDDVTGLAQHHGVTDAYTLAGDLLGVVQGRELHLGAGHYDRFHHPVGRELGRASSRER